MSVQAVRRDALGRWRARRVGTFLLGAGLLVLAAVVLPWGLIFLLELLGLTPDRGRIWVK